MGGQGDETNLHGSLIARGKLYLTAITGNQMLQASLARIRKVLQVHLPATYEPFMQGFLFQQSRHGDSLGP